MNQQYDCPNCGGSVAFLSSIAVFAVCPYCRSMVVRHDVNVEAIGEMAALPPDLSPLQIGVKGVFQELGFTLIGRVRVAYSAGSWNEWCALFSDGRYGWVAEAEGFFMVSFEYAPTADVPANASGLAVGRLFPIAGTNYTVNDRKETTCLGGEGELPFLAKPGREANSVDLSGADGQFASIEYSGDGIRLFTGQYARFDDLQFSGLRPVPGWTEGVNDPKRSGTTSLQCPNCGAAVSLKAAGLTMSATCGSCHSLIDTATPDLRLISRASERQRIQPKIPLGRRGELFGVKYELIGFQHVRDQYSGWHEYLLFNPWQGFVWLVNYRGHWTFVRRLYEQPLTDTANIADAAEGHAVFQGESYKAFSAGRVKTEYVVGEFYWKVEVGMSVLVADYIKPPRILSRETYLGLTEATWSQGEYVEPAVIEKAFQLEAPLGEPLGIYLNQPNPHSERAKPLFWLTPVFVALLVAIQMVSAGRAAHAPVFKEMYEFHSAATNSPVLTREFEIKGGAQALEFNLQASCDNNWIELEVDLVNAQTHQVAANFTQVVEYYHGNDDGPWSEGSQHASVLVPGVSPGKYYLTIDASADPAVRTMPYHVEVVRDVVIWSNFWIALGLLLIYPAYRCYLHYVFEKARWDESEFAGSDGQISGTESGDDDDEDEP